MGGSAAARPDRRRTRQDARARAAGRRRRRVRIVERSVLHARPVLEDRGGHRARARGRRRLHESHPRRGRLRRRRRRVGRRSHSHRRRGARARHRLAHEGARARQLGQEQDDRRAHRGRAQSAASRCTPISIRTRRRRRASPRRRCPARATPASRKRWRTRPRGKKFLGLVRENIRRRGGATSIVIASGRGAPDQAGRNLEEIAKARGVAAGAGGRRHRPRRRRVDRLVQHVGGRHRDDHAAAVDDGVERRRLEPAGPARPHPRGNGAFARRLGALRARARRADARSPRSAA